MGSPSTRHMFNFPYEKPVPVIKAAITVKVAALKEKIAEREDRVVRIRKEYGITDTDLINLLTQAAASATRGHATAMSYSLSNSASPDGDDDPKIIGAGVVQNLLTERGLIEEERASVQRLERIGRNLGSICKYADDGTMYWVEAFELNDAELEYLGF